MSAEVLRRGQRQAYGLLIYRSALTFVLLMVAFRSFPEHRPVIGLAVIFVNQAIAAIGQGVSGVAATQNFLLDMAERKTRHTILLATDRDRPGYLLEADFWNDVNRRVDAELEPQPPSPPWWKATGLIFANAAGHLLGDVILVVCAAGLAGS